MHEETSTCTLIKIKRQFVKQFIVPLEMLSKLMGNKFSRVTAKYKIPGNVFKPNKSIRKVTVFTKEKFASSMILMSKI